MANETWLDTKVISGEVVVILKCVQIYIKLNDALRLEPCWKNHVTIARMAGLRLSRLIERFIHLFWTLLKVL